MARPFVGHKRLQTLHNSVLQAMASEASAQLTPPACLLADGFILLISHRKDFMLPLSMMAGTQQDSVKICSCHETANPVGQSRPDPAHPVGGVAGGEGGGGGAQLFWLAGTAAEVARGCTFDILVCAQLGSPHRPSLRDAPAYTKRGGKHRWTRQCLPT